MSDLWQLVWGKQQIDPVLLAQAIENELSETQKPDFRTRLLIRDSTEALQSFWGDERLEQWLKQSTVGDRIKGICEEKLGEPGFHFLKEQIMEKTEPKVVQAFLRELGSHIAQPVTLYVGGSIALILSGQLDRATDDIDVVDEVPETIRSKTKMLEDLQHRYRLLLTHFQSHYLPRDWQQRVRFLDSFGSLQVYTVDPCDIFVSKLFSERAKDLDDLREIEPKLDRQMVALRVKKTTADLRKQTKLLEAAERNWYILFGEALPALE